MPDVRIAVATRSSTATVQMAATTPVDIRDLQDLSGKLTDEWRDVARNLRLKDEDIYTISIDYKDSIKETKYQMLFLWSKRSGQNATYDTLAEALRNAGRADLVNWLVKKEWTPLERCLEDMNFVLAKTDLVELAQSLNFSPEDIRQVEKDGWQSFKRLCLEQEIISQENRRDWFVQTLYEKDHEDALQVVYKYEDETSLSKCLSTVQGMLSIKDLTILAREAEFDDHELQRVEQEGWRRFIELTRVKKMIAAGNCEWLLTSLTKCKQIKDRGAVKVLSEYSHDEHRDEVERRRLRRMYPFVADVDFDSFHEGPTKINFEILNVIHKRRLAIYSNYVLSSNINIVYWWKSDPLRLVILGKCGSGISSTGNTLIGKNVFETAGGCASVTNSPMYVENNIYGRKISVIDTPGLMHTLLATEEITKAIRKEIVRRQRGGIHAFVYVRNASEFRYTEDCREASKIIKSLVGAKFAKYCLVCLTHADDTFRDISLDRHWEEFRNNDPLFRDVDKKVVAVNNAADSPGERRRNQNVLIAMVDKMREENHSESLKLPV